MAYYFNGYSDARAHVAEITTQEELLAVLDPLYGRDNLKFGATLEDIRDEAYRQLEREFTDKSSAEYERRQS